MFSAKGRPADLHEAKQREGIAQRQHDTATRVERAEALLEYTAMMADIELPEEDEDDE